MSRSRYRHFRRRAHQRRPRSRNPGVRYRSGYSHGASVERMYRKLRKYGAQALSKRELKLLRREMDLDVRNPHRDGRPTKGELRRARRTGRYDFEPDYSPRYRRRLRNPLTCGMSRESMFHELKHHASRWRPQKQRVAIVLSTLRKCGRRNPKRRARRIPLPPRCDYPERVLLSDNRRLRHHWDKVTRRRNPKRDGSPTRGEMRRTKYAAHLKSIAQRGKDAEAILHRITAAPATSKAAVKEHLPAASVAVLEAPPAKVEAAVEHAEAKILRSRIDDLNILHKDLLLQIEALGDDDLTASEAEDLTEQATKIAKQRAVLRGKAKGLGIQTNPPRRRGRVLIGLRAYGVALRHLRHAIRALR